MHARGYLIDDLPFQLLTSLKLALSDDLQCRLKARASTKLKPETTNRSFSNVQTKNKNPMVRYRRNFIADGTFFFTVKLAAPKSHLLIEHIDFACGLYRCAKTISLLNHRRTRAAEPHSRHLDAAAR